MTDSGLMAHLLRKTDIEEIVNDFDVDSTVGRQLVQTWVYNQLASEVDLNPTLKIWHFRNRSHTIDFLITDVRGRMIGIQVRSRQSVSSKDFDDLKWFAQKSGQENFTGIVLYAGKLVISGGRGSNCYALPMSCLWDDFAAWRKLSAI